MAISYPRELPAALLKAPRFRFDYEPLGALSQTAGGSLTFQERAGGSLWQMDLTTKGLAASDFVAARAWFRSLRGGAQAFRGYDLRQPFPQAYGPAVLDLTRAAGGAFDGTCTVTAAGGHSLALSGLPAGYHVSVGDYFSFAWRGGQALVESWEDVQADGSGVCATFEVGPWLAAGGTVPVTATVVRAWCLMRPKPGSWQGVRTARDPVVFEAIQDLG